MCCHPYLVISDIQSSVPTLYVDHISIFLQGEQTTHIKLYYPTPQLQTAAYQPAAGEGYTAPLEGYTAAVEVDVELPVVGPVDPTAPDELHTVRVSEGNSSGQECIPETERGR